LTTFTRFMPEPVTWTVPPGLEVLIFEQPDTQITSLIFGTPGTVSPPSAVVAAEAVPDMPRRATRIATARAGVTFFTKALSLPAELAGGLALKESRYGAVLASDSPHGEKFPLRVLRPGPTGPG